jgi:hypothetical protein
MAAQLLFYLLVLALCSTDGADVLLLSNFTISCLDAKNANFTFPTSSSAPYCGDIVDWSTANLYNNAYYQRHNPGIGLSQQEQDQVAKSTATYLHSLITTNTASEECAKAIKWYSCIQTFPYCPFSGHSQNSGVSYLPACEIHCDQIREHCGLTDNDLLLCGSKSMQINALSKRKFHDISLTDQYSLWKANENKNCLTFVPSDMRLLPPQRVSIANILYPPYLSLMHCYMRFRNCCSGPLFQSASVLYSYDGIVDCHSLWMVLLVFDLEELSQSRIIAYSRGCVMYSCRLSRNKSPTVVALQ